MERRSVPYGTVSASWGIFPSSAGGRHPFDSSGRASLVRFLSSQLVEMTKGSVKKAIKILELLVAYIQQAPGRAHLGPYDTVCVRSRPPSTATVSRPSLSPSQLIVQYKETADSVMLSFNNARQTPSHTTKDWPS